VLGKLTNIDKLEIGMLLDRDVIDIKTGAVLIPENTAITKAFIDKLNIHGIHFVFIKDEIIRDEIENEKLTKEYSKIESTLDNVFNEIKEGKQLESDKIISEMNTFVDEIASERDILTQMRLLQKKDDYTFNHSLGVSILAASLGKWMNYSKDKILDSFTIWLSNIVGNQ